MILVGINLHVDGLADFTAADDNMLIAEFNKMKQAKADLTAENLGARRNRALLLMIAEGTSANTQKVWDLVDCLTRLQQLRKLNKL